MPRKPDADEILDHMQQLSSSLKLDRNRSFWPQWLFRSDHVENTADILNSGRLLSRDAAKEGKLIRVDSGSPHYTSRLSEQHRKLVRLYFRPRTPTQCRNEGIRPQSGIELDAHMPVPVYLLFSVRLLAEEGFFFTKGRLTEGTEIGDSAKFLKSIEFGDVYHDRGVGGVGESERRAQILNARNSEIVIENELSLSQLKHIVCRSAAERETLVSLLSSEARLRWVRSIHVDEGHRRMFEKRGTFAQRAELSSASSQFQFYSNINAEMRGPFDLMVEWTLGGGTESVRQEDFRVSHRPVVFPLNPPTPKYHVRVLLDGNLAYLGEFDDKHASGILF